MSGSSLTFEAKITLLKAIMLPAILALSLTLVTGSLIVPLYALCGICGLVFGLMALNIVRHHQVSVLAAHYDAGNLDRALTSPTSKNIEPKAFTRPITCAFKTVPTYCTPLGTLNQMSPETGELGEHDAHTTVTIVEGSDDDCTFATSPFTSPPMYTVEIFVRKEETIVYEDITTYVPSGTPSPLILDRDLPGMATPALTELFKYCEAAIMESNMRDMELL